VRARLQVRARCRFGLAGEEETDAIWRSLGAGARRAYGGSPAPGAPLDAPGDHAAEPEAARFRAICGAVDRFDVLYLGADRHRRAVFMRDDAFRKALQGITTLEEVNRRTRVDAPLPKKEGAAQPEPAAAAAV